MRATHYIDPETEQTVVELRMDDQELKESLSSKQILDRVNQLVAGEIAGLICLKIWPGIEAALSGGFESTRPAPPPIIVIGQDGRCNCNAGTTCPLGKTGAEERCTKVELERKAWNEH